MNDNVRTKEREFGFTLMRTKVQTFWLLFYLKMHIFYLFILYHCSCSKGKRVLLWLPTRPDWRTFFPEPCTSKRTEWRFLFFSSFLFNESSRNSNTIHQFLVHVYGNERVVVHNISMFHVLCVRPIGYRREDFRFPVSASCVTLSNPDSLSSSETWDNPMILK